MNPSRPHWQIWIWYAISVVAAVAGFEWIRAYGEKLTASSTVEAAAVVVGTPFAGNIFIHVLLALTVVLVAARLLGAAVGKLNQPPVIGELLAGIRLPVSFFRWCFPTSIPLPRSLWRLDANLLWRSRRRRVEFLRMAFCRRDPLLLVFGTPRRNRSRGGRRQGR